MIRKNTFWITSLFALLSVAVVAAQPNACTPFVQDALTALEDTCTGLIRNTACYGNTLVQASFTEATDDPQFALPSDKIALTLLAGLRAAAYDADEETWGIAVVNAQANLPGTLPGQGVVMLMMGDTEVTNQVAPEDAFLSLPPLETTVNTQGARVRSGAGLNFNITTSVPLGAPVEIDARNPQGDWLRVVYDGVGGWIFRDLVNLTSADVEGLPVVDDTILTPMQAFYFSTGIGSPTCNEAPDAVLIQSPENTRVTLLINEAEITLGSTVIVETEPDQMILYVLDGVAEVNNLVVPEGYKAFVPISESGQVVADLSAQGITTVQATQLPVVTGQWRQCNSISDADRERFAQLPNIPASLLNYPVELPGAPLQFCASPEELAALQQQQTTQPTPAPVVTTEEAAPPAPNMTEEAAPPAPNMTEEVIIVDGYDCSPFRLASPREGMAFGNQIFYWDPTNPGAVSYDVFVYDNSGAVVAQTTTSATNATLDTGDRNPGGGVFYSWTVQAKDANGNVVCGPLEPAVQLREAAPIVTPEPENTEDPNDQDDHNDNDNEEDYVEPVCSIAEVEAEAKSACAYGYSINGDACSYTCDQPAS